MTKNRYRIYIFLMAFSILLLIVLQAFWLRAEYRSASDAFRRETNLVFRNTMFQVSDSLVIHFFRQIAGNDTTQLSRGGLARTMSAEPGDSAGTRRSFRFSNISAFELDDIKPADSVYTASGLPFGPIQTDTLAVQYVDALRSHDIHLPVNIITRRAEWPGSYRGSDSLSDSLPWATSPVPFGMHSYMADFEGVKKKLLTSLMPQFGFSIFITLVILLSFVLIARGLRSQQLLIEQKNDFIGNITHELKTPVATVEAALEAMKHFDVLKDKEKTGEYLDMATHELNRLGMITDKILKTSVFDYQKDIRQYKSPVDLGDLTDRVLSSFRLTAQKNSTEFAVEKKGTLNIKGNESHLTQMIYNLLDNALKYAPESPLIHLSLTGSDASVVLKIKDQGPGIHEMHQKRIFEKFYRVPSGDIHNVKGYGLGLHYVKGVVNAHNGKINIESKVGCGAMFVIKLPKNG